MQLRIALLIAAVIGLVFLVACGNGDGDAPATATLQPDGPTATQEVLPTVPPSADIGATLVFVRDDDLWIAPLDGSGEPRAVTTGSGRAAYAGYVVRQDGGIDLYYISQLEESEAFDEPVEFGAYRVALEGGEPEELFRFPTDTSHLAGAAVAPNGERMVYADAEALILRDLASGEETVLGRSRYVLAGDGTYIRTGQLTIPLWSPAGEQVYISRFAGPDTIVSVIVDLPPRQVILADIDYPGHRGVWSPDGSRLCLYSGDIYEGGLTLYDVENRERTDVLAMGLFPPRVENAVSRVGGCAWSDDGRLALSYAPSDTEPPAIYILDPDLNLVDQSEPLEPFVAVIDWLPDGSGVVISERTSVVELLSIGIYRPGEAIEYMSYETGWEQAVVP